MMEIETTLPGIETDLPQIEAALLEIEVVSEYESRVGRSRFQAGRKIKENGAKRGFKGGSCLGPRTKAKAMTRESISEKKF